MNHSQSHYLKSRDGLNLHYLTWGDRASPAIILLHGLRSYALTWAPLAEILSQQFYVIALDQRGRGLSDWAENYETYQTKVYVEDLEDLVKCENLEKFIMIGHSLGGTNALEYNRLHPEKVSALIIEDIGPGSSIQGDGAERIRREMQNTPLEFATWQQAIDFWKKLRPLIGQEGIQSRVENTLVEKDGKIIWKHDQQGIAKARLNIASTDLWPAVEQIDCPTLFIKGGLSDFLPSTTLEAIRFKKPDIEFIEIADASHYVHDDQAEMYNQAVIQFLSKID
ncbi:alpha/beta fold hydrolase [Acinetobacter gerneri]|uniref:alpha/beta fold hydrolase n=1 Tax=Acinetobacter gerneri TaxID=202952 RepID=UPI0032121A03